ncbi:MAG: hypothetical protein GWO24_34680 [Akkermansiaceae bacterium]|nr:hypothetical protein [Akkermansiaceae bacterium]
MNSLPSPVLTLLVALATVATVTVAAQDEKDPSVVFLARHAELMDASRDPELSLAGKERAEALAAALRSSGITQGTAATSGGPAIPPRRWRR